MELEVGDVAVLSHEPVSETHLHSEEQGPLSAFLDDPLRTPKHMGFPEDTQMLRGGTMHGVGFSDSEPMLSPLSL